MPEESEPTCNATRLIDAAMAGDRAAAENLLPLVYDQLRRAAQLHMVSERTGHTLSATALVHEAYLKLVGPRDVPWESQGHFYAAAAEAMRRVLLDHSKARGRLKRGGAARRIELEAAAQVPGDRTDEPDTDPTDFVALDDAICRLEARDARAGRVVRLRFYAGLGIAQTALALGVSERTVKNDWAFAKAWLERELAARSGSGSEPDRE
jgi:RNA polymerase sigma-70 factor, ECF subfamily